jgi:hypothetical protein
MLGFARFDDAVIDFLVFGQTPRAFDDALSRFRERQYPERFPSGDGQCSLGYQALLLEPPDIPFHARVVGRIDKPSEVGRSSDAKLTQFPHRLKFRFAKKEGVLA